jgi:hypothetical protein
LAGALLLVGQRPQRVFSLLAPVRLEPPRTRPKFAAALLYQPRTWCTRILEKQNLLQMSQVFSVVCALINRQVVLLFKDSKSGTAEHGGTDLKKILKARTSEKQTHYAHCARGFAPQQKFGPAISEAAESQADATASAI